MNARTINELYEELKKQRALGNGEKKILIATDDEGNGFRPMYYLISETKGNVDYSTLYGISKEEAEENCVILG